MTAVTCDGNSPNYDTGCALLLRFDADNDGIISTTELQAAIAAKIGGDITQEELVFVSDAYVAGSINAVCTGCYTAPCPDPSVSDISWSPASPTTDDTITFGQTSSAGFGQTISSYDWDFGDSTTHGTGATPTHTYATAGTYSVTLVVTNDCDGTASRTESITIFLHIEDKVVVTLYQSTDRDDATTVEDTDILFYAQRMGGGAYALIHYWPPWVTDFEWAKLALNESTASTDPDDSENWITIKLINVGEGWISVEVERHIPPAAPTISALSWSPAGDFTKLASGASIDGDTESLMLIATDPDDVVADLPAGEAMLQITDADGNIGDAFTVAEYDHFRFDDKEWWALNIVCYPDCDFIILADEIAEAEKVPKIGDTVKFAAAIDWHDKEMSSIRWFFGKPPDECFIADDIDWTEFAVGENTDMPSHTFENDDDIEIIFLKVVAVNKSGAVGEYTDLCNTIFNIWAPSPAFDENWLIAAFMTYIIPGLAEKFEYLSDLVYDGDAEPTSGGFSLLWSPVEFVMWIAVALTDIAEDILDIVFGEAEAEETSGYSILWSATQFMTWLYKSIAAKAEAILDLVFKDD